MGFVFISTQPLHMARACGAGSGDALLSGRSQVAAGAPADLAAFEQRSGLRAGLRKGESPDGWEEPPPFLWPHACGQCREVTDKGERLRCWQRHLEPIGPWAAWAKSQRPKRCPTHGCNMEHTDRASESPLGVAAGEELHCKVKELTFTEQAAWLPSVSCTWHSPAAPGNGCSRQWLPARPMCGESHSS